jgi:hypothetical protein
MEGEVAGAVITGIVFVSVIVLIKLLSDNKIRSKLIDKGMVDENVKFLFFDRQEFRAPAALKWGMVLIGIGLAFIIGQLVPADISGEVTVGCMFLMAGLGLIIYYFLAKSMSKQAEEDASRK